MKLNVVLARMHIDGSLATAVARSLIVRAGAMIAAFGCHLLLTRGLGARDYGIYAYAIAWVRFLGVPSAVALERMIGRIVARSRIEDDGASARAVAQWADRRFGGGGAVLALVASTGLWLFAGPQSWAVALAIALMAVPLLALSRIRQYQLQGWGHPIAAQVPESLLLPIALATGLASFRLLHVPFEASAAVSLYVGACLSCLAAVQFFAVRYRPAAQAGTARGAIGVRSAYLPLLGMSGLTATLLFVPTVMLGLLADATEVGRLTIANTLADLALVPSIALLPIFAPMLANEFAQRPDMPPQRVYVVFTRLTTLGTIPVGLVLIGFGPYILTLFGTDFASAYPAVAMLAFAQMVSAAAGSNATLLTLSGHERIVAQVSGYAVIACILTSALLIPIGTALGSAAAGAAMASAICQIGWNVALAWYSWRSVAIRPTVCARMMRS